MRLDLTHLLDPVPAVIVVGGTLLATMLRAGRADCTITVAQIGALFKRRFNPALMRSGLAPLASEIRRDGVFRAHARPTGDAATDSAITAMIAGHSAALLLRHHAKGRKARLTNAHRAAMTLAQAADLAPVFGLAGTLVSLAQLSGQGIARAQFMNAISMSVLATLDGLLLANIVLAPLAHAIERHAEREEVARQDLMDWIAAQFSVSAPRLRRDPSADSMP